MLVDRELAWRDTRRLERLLRAAKLKNPEPASKTLNTGKPVGWTSASSPRSPAATGCAMLQNLILTGPPPARARRGSRAFGQQACRQGFSVFYVRVARLFEELKIAHGDGSFTRRLAQLAG